jgi:hypothetical protein
MSKKIVGIALCIAGVASLIISLIYISIIGNPSQVALLLAGGIIGTVAFFMGIRIIPGSPMQIVHPRRPHEQPMVQQN